MNRLFYRALSLLCCALTLGSAGCGKSEPPPGAYGAPPILGSSNADGGQIAGSTNAPSVGAGTGNRRGASPKADRDPAASYAPN